MNKKIGFTAYYCIQCGRQDIRSEKELFEHMAQCKSKSPDSYTATYVNLLNDKIQTLEAELSALKETVKEKEIAAFKAGKEKKLVPASTDEEMRIGVYIWVDKFLTLEDYLKEKEK